MAVNYGKWGNPQDDYYYNTYRQALDSYSQAQMEGALGANRSAENDLYRYIGVQQQNMEREIKQRRMQALKTGATSAQLASQELQTMLAAQQGAQQVAKDYMNQRQAIEGQYAGYQQGNEVRALEDYAYRMTQADNIQAQYDVSRMQMDPSLSAQYMAEAAGYQWDTLSPEDRQMWYSIASGTMDATEFKPSGSTPTSTGYYKGAGSTANNYGLLAGLSDLSMGWARAGGDVIAGRGNQFSNMMEYSQASLRGDWNTMNRINPKKVDKKLKKQGLTKDQVGIIDEIYNN